MARRAMQPLATAACLLLTAWVGAVHAANPCASEGGIGGTGKPALSSQEDNSRPKLPPAGGIGGTGVTAGTERPAGVLGVITRFASICVNGIEVSYRSDTPVAQNGEVAAARNLERGQVVKVEATEYEARQFRASRIDILDSIVGPVTQQDAKRRMFWVMGQPVTIANEAVVAISGTGIPAIGSTVRVSGITNGDGRLIASRIEGASSIMPAHLMARVQQIDGRVVQLGYVRVELPVVAQDAGIRLGQELAVIGHWDGESIVAASYRTDPSLKFGTRPERLSLQGYLLRCEGTPYYGIEGLQLTFANPNAVPNYAGRHVVVEGDVQQDGVLRVDNIELRNPGGASMPSAAAPIDPAKPSKQQEQLALRASCGRLP